MNILAIIGTNRKSGTVSRLCGNILEAAEKNGHTTETVNLYDYSIEPCRGCWACAKTGACVIKDDFKAVFEKITAADVVILGTPCYWGGVSGVMKNFFDRHTGAAMYKPENADSFQAMSFAKKVQTVVREVKNFGPHQAVRGKGFILVTAMTVFFPLSYLMGDRSGTLKGLNIYRKKMKGRLIGKIVYTDTLFRFRKGKEQHIMEKAAALGNRL